MPRSRKRRWLPWSWFVLLAVAALGGSSSAAEPDAAEIVRLAFEHDEENDKLARHYTFHERDEERNFNKKGAIKSSKSKTYDITMLDGSHYQRLIAKNDKPLSPKDEQKEQRKLDKSIKRMQEETPKQRAKRRAKEEKKKAEQRRWIPEVLNSYHFRLAAEETVGGIECYVVEAEPKVNYKPKFKKAKFLTNLRGRMYISKQENAWVKVEAETIKKVSFGWVLFRLGKGAVMEVTQQQVNDEVWLVDRFRVRFTARLGLVKGFNQEVVSTFSNFRKFSADSNVVFGDVTE